MPEHVDVVGVHGFPLDWNHWHINEWPTRIAEAHEVSGKPVWVLGCVSSFGADGGSFAWQFNFNAVEGSLHVMSKRVLITGGAGFVG